MAINETIRDIVNYPSISKTVTLDLAKVVPVDNEGDEVYVITASTSASTALGTSTTINPMYIREFKSGYARSSGFKAPNFTITASNNEMLLSIDGSSYQTVVLSQGNGLSGENVAKDLQTKISALGGAGGPEEGNLSFLNSIVSFENNKFLVIAGSISDTYTGVGKTSVSILPGSGNDVSADLGFDIYVDSESLASLQPTETTVSSGYTGGTSLSVTSVQDLSIGDAFVVNDGTNKEYFVAEGISTGNITISGAGLANTYVEGSVVQKIFERDVDAGLASPLETIDHITRFALHSMGNQINFG